MNQNPEQIARDNIDRMLQAAGWAVQDVSKFNPSASLGVAVKEYPTDTGPADYILFVERQPLGVVEAKREEEGHRLTVHEAQTEIYSRSKLKWVANNQSLPFVYESTGVVTRFTDYRDPKPRSRPVFSFHRPETFKVEHYIFNLRLSFRPVEMTIDFLIKRRRRSLCLPKIL